ncbi:SSI family serine proteinase inhibitor [Blastococcus haudaquaticus]|uniref:Subtilisin inhibitor-like n=1 Tax=Blastococcus haudaquaticus TaxID=1938745 RepID=A0A286H6E5_9ACTN|nr:SSI family serine proteinase inhibitor [Blastococcus haudaquaticus]SOE03321.1 Subtilisin inhibitor-like [Blastococcus haudaquaticus]
MPPARRGGRMRRALIAASLVIAGCGSEDDGPGTRFPSMEATGSVADRWLQITVDPGDGAAPQTYTLVCDGTDGAAHPDPAAACAHLETLDDPFAPLPDDVACTQQYGGPQTASVTGRWDAAAVDRTFSRTDGCRIAQWDGLGPLLPALGD